MSNNTIRIPLRRASTLEWTNSTLILSSGELAFEIDTGKLKVGDGVNRWINLPYLFSTTTSSIGQLTDVVLTSSLSNGQVLNYNSTTNKWTNVDVTISQSAIDNIYATLRAANNVFTGNNTFSNITVSALNLSGDIAPSTDDQYKLGLQNKRWNDFFATYIHVDDAYIDTIHSDSIITTLSGLTDTNITSPSANQYLKYDSTTQKWVNDTITLSSSLNDLTNVSIDTTTLSTGQVLKYNGSNWINSSSGETTTVAFEDISGNPTDNYELDLVLTSLQNQINSKQATLTAQSPIAIENNVIKFTGTVGGGDVYLASNNIFTGTTNRFNDITSNTITPSLNNSYSLGVSNTVFKNTYTTSLFTNNISSISDDIILNSNVIPNGIISLGNSVSQFNNVYSTNFIGNLGNSVNYNNAYIDTLYLKTNLSPNNSNVSLGSSDNKIKYGYFDTLNFNTLNATLNLNDLSDVNATSPNNGQALTWNSTSSKWVPATISGGGSGGRDADAAHVNESNTFTSNSNNIFNGITTFNDNILTTTSSGAKPNIGSSDYPFNIAYFKSLKLNNQDVATQEWVVNSYQPIINDENKLNPLYIEGIDNYATKQWIEESGYLTANNLLDQGLATQSWVQGRGYLTSVSWSDISSKPSFATVATSGSYNDLSNKPTIPSAANNGSYEIKINDTIKGTVYANGTGSNTINLGSCVTRTSSHSIGLGYNGTELIADISGNYLKIITHVDIGSQSVANATYAEYAKNNKLKLHNSYDYAIYSSDGRVVIKSGKNSSNPTAYATYLFNSLSSGGSASVAVQTSSDRRLKKNIKNTNIDALQTINNVNIVDFNYIEEEDDYIHTGVIAQELQENTPELHDIVNTNNEYLSVDYARFTPYLIKAVQELTDLVKKQQEEIDFLKSKFI